MMVEKREDVMSGADCVVRGGFVGLLVAALIAVSACGKKKDVSRALKPVSPGAAADSALTDDIAHQPSAPPDARAPEAAPAWALERPHFFERDGRRFACAVGRAKVANVGLARAAAEDRARVELVKLITGAAEGEAVEASLRGARMTDSFTSKTDGQVFVRVEVQTTPAAS